MLANSAGRIFIGRRAKRSDDQESAGHWWQMPQGGIGGSERPEDAALRELREETGVSSAKIIARAACIHRYELPPALMGRIWKGRYCGQEQIWFLLRFEGEESEIVLDAPGHTQEFDRWRWASIEELPELVVPFKRPVYQAVIAEFAPLL